MENLQYLNFNYNDSLICPFYSFKIICGSNCAGKILNSCKIVNDNFASNSHELRINLNKLETGFKKSVKMMDGSIKLQNGDMNNLISVLLPHQGKFKMASIANMRLNLTSYHHVT